MLGKITQGSTLSSNEDLNLHTHSRGPPKDFIFNLVTKDSLKQSHILSVTKKHNVLKFNSIQKTE